VSGTVDIAPLVPFFLPERPKTLLLQTIVAPALAVPPAWSEWLALAGSDPTREIASDRIGARQLMPLILSRLELAGCVIPSEMRTVMRTARTREKLRWETLSPICAGLLSALASDGVACTVAGGVALAAAFDEPWDRHSHDLELVVAERDHDRVVGILESTRLARRGVAPTGATMMDHPSGLPVVIHRHLFDEPGFGHLGVALEKSLVETELFGVRCRTLDATAMLVHVLARAVESPRWRSVLQWVVDAAALMDRADETRFGDLIARSGASGLIGRMKTFVTALAIDEDRAPDVTCVVSEDVVPLCLRGAAGSWRGWKRVWKAVPRHRLDLLVATIAPPAELVSGASARGRLGYRILLVVRAIKFVGRAIAWRVRAR